MADAITRTAQSQSGADVTESIKHSTQTTTNTSPESVSRSVTAASRSVAITQEDKGAQVTFTLKLAGVGYKDFTV